MPRRFALAAFLTVFALAVALVSTAVASPSRSAATPFPATITVSNGQVTIQKRPSRIVSLSATATETLFAIGAGKQVIAVDNQSDYPKTAPRTSLSGFTPNVEAIAGYRPDLVVISYDPKGLSEALGKLGIPVVHQDAAATLPGAYQQIRQLGKITGHTAEANALATGMKRKITAIVAKARAKAVGVTVYHELDPTLFTLTSNTFVGRVYALFGLRNIADAVKGGTEYPAALGRVPDLGEPGPDRARGHGVLCAERADGRGTAGLVEDRGGPHGIGRPPRRLDRVALGTEARQPRPRGRHGARTARPAIAWRQLPQRRARSASAG